MNEDAMHIEIITQDGRERVVLDRQDYEDLIDARDHAKELGRLVAGADALSTEEMASYLVSPSPLAFWRKRAGRSQASLAEAAGVSQPFLAQIEAGKRAGSVAVLARIARVLGLQIEDLIAE